MEGLNKLIKRAEAEIAPSEEKSEGREAIESLASSLIQKRMSELGIARRSFDSGNIIYKNSVEYSNTHSDASSAQYDSGEHLIEARDQGEADLRVITHEMLHAYSSSVSSLDLVNGRIPEEIVGRPLIKSGFNSVWSKGYNKEGKTIGKGLFTAINEAVTEKLARELSVAGNEQFKELKPLFEGRKEEFQYRNQAIFEDTRLPEAKAKDLPWRHETMLAFEKSMDLLNLCIENLGKVDGNAVLTKYWQELADKEQKYLIFLKDRLENGPQEKLAKLRFESDQKEITENYSFDVTKTNAESYSDEIRLLNLFIVRYAEEIMRNKPEVHYTSAREQAWRETQKAYFEGNVFFLRRFDMYFGHGTLQKLQRFSQYTKEEQEALLNKMTAILDEPTMKDIRSRTNLK